MLKNKTLKTILIIFAAITAIGLMASLFGGSPSGDIGKDGTDAAVCEHINDGSGKCKLCGDDIICKHVYSDYNICKLCGESEMHTKIIDTTSLDGSSDIFHYGEFDNHEECMLLVLFNKGKENEEGFYVNYDGSYEYVDYFSTYEITISEDGFTFNAGTWFEDINFNDITVYVADPSATYILLPFDDYYYECFDYYVDGKLVEVTDYSKTVCGKNLKIVLKDEQYLLFYIVNPEDTIDNSNSIGEVTPENPELNYEFSDGYYVLRFDAF